MRFSPYKLYIYIIVLLSVYISGSAIIGFDDSGLYSKSTYSLLVCLLFPIAIHACKKCAFNKLPLKFAVIFLCYSIYTYLKYSERITNLLFVFALFLLMYVSFEFRKDFSEKVQTAYKNIIYTLSVISLIFFVLDQIVGCPLPYNIIDLDQLLIKNYFNLYCTMSNTERVIGSSVIHRLQGPFWEPGVFAIHLNIYLFIILFKVKNERKKFLKLFIVLTCMLLSFSTTGIIVSIIMFSSWLYLSSRIKGKILLLMPLMLVSGLLVFETYYSKRYVTSVGSYLLRLNDLFTGLEIWRDNFLLGVGYKNRHAFASLQNLGRFSTNGIIELCYTTGVLGLAFYIYPFVKRLLTIHKEKFQYLLFCFMFFIENMSEPFYTMPLSLYILALEYYLCKRVDTFE